MNKIVEHCHWCWYKSFATCSSLLYIEHVLLINFNSKKCIFWGSFVTPNTKSLTLTGVNTKRKSRHRWWKRCPNKRCGKTFCDAMWSEIMIMKYKQAIHYFGFLFLIMFTLCYWFDQIIYRCRHTDVEKILFQPLTNYSTPKAKTCQCSGKNLIC